MNRTGSIASVRCALGLCAVACAGSAAVAATLEIKLGETVARSWADVEKDGYVYGPKQAYDAKAGETHVWLPYGSKGVYFETRGLSLTNPGKQGTGVPLATTVDGNTSGRLVYKLRFDKPIGAFRAAAGWSEWGVGGATVGGVEYSADGKAWTSLREVTAGGIVEPLLDPAKVKVEGLHTRELYLRFFSRHKQDPEGEFGPGRWMKLRMGGDPAWGDRAETFFRSQLQLWVKASDKPDDAPVEEDAAAASTVPNAVRSADPPLGNSGPWGMASGAEWAGDFPQFIPLLKEAGVRWFRYFPEWQSIQPRQGEWKWDYADRLVTTARENGIQLTGVLAYFAPWASADGGTRRGPVKDMQYWRDYACATFSRYRNDIRHWEVWNEVNVGFYQGIDKPKEYSELVAAAYEEARKVDAGIRIGIGVANFDVGFLDAAIRAGARDHFDYVAVHPYENIAAAMAGGESGYLSLAGSLRRMLKANGQRDDIELWITETGVQSTIDPNEVADAKQAEAMAKVYVLSVAQGFERVCWFEVRGPAYGKGTDHGIIRKDWSVRPAYGTLQAMTRVLGPAPRYAGWLKLSETGYGFVFETEDKPVLVAWMPPAESGRLTFDAPVQVVDIAGGATELAAGAALALSRVPLFVAGLPAPLVAQARAQKDQPFPWGKDFSKAAVATCRLGAKNLDQGVQQVRSETTAVVNDLTESWRRTDFAHGGEGRYVYFRVDPTFAGFGNKAMEVTVVARRTDPAKDAGMNLTYESIKGYRNAGSWFGLPAGDGWHEHTWKVDDANFVGGWGWNFRTDSVASGGEVSIREVRVKLLDRTP